MILKDLHDAIAIIEKQRIFYASRLVGSVGANTSKNFFEVAKSREVRASAAAQFAELMPAEQVKRMRAARILQVVWHHKLNQDTLITVNPYGNHRDDVLHLLHGVPTIKKKLNREQRRVFLQALDANNWQSAIFKDPFLLEIAMAAFIENQISMLQMETVLGFHEASRNIDGTTRAVSSYAILTPEGQLTSEAQTLLMPYMNNFMYQTISEQQRNNFIWLVRAYIKQHASENLFYSYEFTVHDNQLNPLAGQLQDLQATIWLSQGSSSVRTILHLSASARDAIRLAVFGLEDCMPARVMLGELTIGDIEEGVFKGYRPKAAYFPCVKSNINIHDFPCVDVKTISDHDDYHADMGCRTGFVLRRVLQECVNIIRQTLLYPIGLKHSALTWRLVDGEFNYLNKVSVVFWRDDRKSIAETFSRMFLSQSFELATKPSLVDYNMQLNDAGICCMIHMAKNLTYWQDMLKFYPDLMSSLFKNFFKRITNLTALFTDDVIQNILIYRLYDRINDERLFPIWLDVFQHQYLTIKNRFEIKRCNQFNFLGVMDIKYQGKASDDFIADLLAELIDLQLTSVLIIWDQPIAVQLATVYLQIRMLLLQRPYIQTEVLDPIRQLLQCMAKHDEIRALSEDELALLERATIKLCEFISFHQERSISPQSSLFTSPRRMQSSLTATDLTNLTTAFELLRQCSAMNDYQPELSPMASTRV